MFGPVQPTGMDLQFHLFGIPVRVLPWFWILAALLGGNLLRAGWQYLVVWMVVVFFSILVHEMGHALTARAFGYFPRVFLYHFGGLAMYTPGHDYTAGRSILITLAGPMAGLALGGMTLIAVVMVRTMNVELTPLAAETLHQMLFVNIGWSLLNLLPVLPLDGGQITRDVCTSLSPARGEGWSLWISLFVAGAISLAGFLMHMTYMGFLFALMCYQSFQTLQARRYWR